MKTDDFARNIYNDLASFGSQHTDPARVEKYKRYFKEEYDAYGLTHELVEEKSKEILALPGISHALVIETSLLLAASPKYEMTVWAIKFIRSYYKQWTVETFRAVEKWFAVGITNWAHTDYICSELFPLFFKKGLITIHDLDSWRFSEYRFQRRSAAVALIKPMKAASDFAPYLDFIEPMMHDRERVVHQGLGWLLREMWKKQPEVVEPFLFRFKDTAPRLIFQYATERMTAEGKEKFRKKK